MPAEPGRRPKTVTTVLGDLRLERACYRCARCGTGFHPRDRAFGIGGASLSPCCSRSSRTAGSVR